MVQGWDKPLSIHNILEFKINLSKLNSNSFNYFLIRHFDLSNIEEGYSNTDKKINVNKEINIMLVKFQKCTI